MKLSDIAIKVTNRNRKAVIAWLENVCVKGKKPSDYPNEIIHDYNEESHLDFLFDNVDNWGSGFESDKVLVTLTEAKKIYYKYNRPQPTHAELKSERGRSSMYKLKYEEAKKYCHKLYAMLDAGATESIRRKKELSSELDSYKERLVERDQIIEGLKISKKELNIELSDLEDKNSKLIKELEEYKLLVSEKNKELEEQVNKHATFKRIAITTIVILTSIILYGLA